MIRDRSLDRWEEFTGLAIKGGLGKSVQKEMVAIPSKKYELLKKIIKIASKAGQVVRNSANQFPSNIETVREIGQRAFLFGWLTDDEIDALISNGGWKK